MAIADSILDAVRAEARRFPGARISKVGVRIGELGGVDPEALSFCFEALVKGTELEPLEIDVEYCPRRHRCGACGLEYAASSAETVCPTCGAGGSEFVSGDELELAYLEVDDAARAARA